MVEYRPIEGFDGYRVGDDGSVWSCWKSRGSPHYGSVISDTWKKLKPIKDQIGRHKVNLYAGGKCYGFRVHQLVLVAFRGPCPIGLEACHNDGDMTNNKLTNLRWDTHANNMRDKIQHGTICKGQEHGQSKLKSEEVLKIRDIFNNPNCKFSHEDVAKSFNVSRATIYLILKHKTWIHLT